MTWTFHSAGSLLFGRGILSRLGEVAGRLRAKRVFVVTDAVLKKAGLVERVTGPLAEAGVTVEVFDGGQPEPALAVIRSAVTAAKAFRPDAVLGLGGGSNMDAAKLTALVLAHGGDATDTSATAVRPAQ
jgi:alcohol dehydrogenase class IV